MERKKRSVHKAKSASGGGRFFRASQLQKARGEDKTECGIKHRRSYNEGESAQGEDPKKQRRDKAGSIDDGEVGVENKVAYIGLEGETTLALDLESSTMKLSAAEIKKRLRALGYPTNLFGESTMGRLKRLRKALDEQRNVQASNEESSEFRLVCGHGIRNPFLEKDDRETTETENGGLVETENDMARSIDADKKEEHDTDLNAENDPHKRVYKYFKGLCKQWEEDLNSRLESAKRSVTGRNETKTFKQCRDYIRPLFKSCKNRRLDESILHNLNKIVTLCLEEEFVKAHDTYIDISIGRAAWPIGVTMVGIHARTGRAKIESSNVAHVMNSELQRKYLTSVKRLMSYAQKKSNADPSKMVR